uniref:Uncharacterized protein n=1 Tax=viral metagenome TaxID=1070528 RepID=A0A6C0HSE8_9ZZZZ
MNKLYYIVIIILIIFATKLFYESEVFNLKCIISDVDGLTYCVRDRKNKQDSANLLAEVNQRCKSIVEYLQIKYPTDERIVRLTNGFNPRKINEILPTSKLTAYSENKGEKIAFCLNKKAPPNNTEYELIDIETLTFVAYHELTHVMCKSYGHNDEFWNNFKFVLENAKSAGLYQSKDYKKKPVEYCGMKITDNPYYDF